MTQDERDILTYFKNHAKRFISTREVSRQVGGRERFEEDRNWPIPSLKRLAMRGHLEHSSAGEYKLCSPDKAVRRARTYFSPQIAKILQNAGWDLAAFGGD